MRHALAVLALSASAAVAQEAPPCGPSSVVESTLLKKYGESIVGAGIDGQGMPVFIVSNPLTGSFTIIGRRPGNITCIITGGTGYTAVAPETPGNNL